MSESRRLRISVLCSDPAHPVMHWLAHWAANRAQDHDITIHHKVADLPGGDLLFLVSCSELVGPRIRHSYEHSLVLHASDLPEGRGWSPHVWSILDGRDTLTVTLLEAEDAVDTGAIWAKRQVPIARHALWDEIDEALFGAELSLMDEAVQKTLSGNVMTQPQSPEGATWNPRRRPSDSEVDPNRAIAEQWDALRIAHPTRYPAFFRLHGHRYAITLRKLNDD